MASIFGTSGDDTITPAGNTPGVTGGLPGNGNDSIFPLGGRNTVDAGGGDDLIESEGVDRVEGGAGTDTWRLLLRGEDGLTLTRGAPTTIALSNGALGTGIEQVEAYLGARATVILGGGPVGSLSLIQVGSGFLDLDWSAKTTTGFINLDNSLSYGNIANSFSDEILNLSGFTSVRFRGGSGNDQIRGLAAGASTLDGGAGNDSIWTTGPGDRIEGGAGIDHLNAFLGGSNGLQVTQTSATGFGFSNGTVATGIETYSILLGADATVALRSGGAPGRFSEVSVASGTLTLDWRAKSAGSYVQAGDALSFGNRNGDWLQDELLSLYGFSRATILTGAGDDVIFGTAGADLIRAGAGNDQIVQTGGSDRLFGVAGDDTYFYGAAGLAPREFSGEGTDTIVTSVSMGLAAHIENLVLFGTADLAGTGNALANRLTGNDGANLLRGGAGDDTLEGGLGADRLDGGAGRDVFLYTRAAEGGDRIFGFVSGEDRIEILAEGFGLLAGAAPPLIQNLSGRANSAPGTGQFVFETDAGRLWWDADGSGGAAGVLIATLVGVGGLAAGDLLLV